MRVRTVVIATAWAVSLLGVGLWAQGQDAPSIQVAPVAPAITPTPGSAGIITGEDIGFRLAPGRTDAQGRVAGHFVVRIDGQWHEIASAPRMVPLR